MDEEEFEDDAEQLGVATALERTCALEARLRQAIQDLHSFSSGFKNDADGSAEREREALLSLTDQLELLEDKLREYRALDLHQYDDKTVTLSQLDSLRRELITITYESVPHIRFAKEVVHEVMAFAEMHGDDALDEDDSAAADDASLMNGHSPGPSEAAALSPYRHGQSGHVPQQSGPSAAAKSLSQTMANAVYLPESKVPAAWQHQPADRQHLYSGAAQQCLQDGQPASRAFDGAYAAPAARSTAAASNLAASAAARMPAADRPMSLRERHMGGLNGGAAGEGSADHKARRQLHDGSSAAQPLMSAADRILLGGGRGSQISDGTAADRILTGGSPSWHTAQPRSRNGGDHATASDDSSASGDDEHFGGHLDMQGYSGCGEANGAAAGQPSQPKAHNGAREPGRRRALTGIVGAVVGAGIVFAAGALQQQSTRSKRSGTLHNSETAGFDPSMSREPVRGKHADVPRQQSKLFPAMPPPDINLGRG